MLIFYFSFSYTTGRPTEGNGTVVVSVYPPASLCYQNPAVYYNKSDITPVMLRQVYPYVSIWRGAMLSSYL
jgi:hypothetical protein